MRQRFDPPASPVRRRIVFASAAAALSTLGNGLARTAAAATGERAAPTRMPSVFIGHGSPMNALRDNAWTRMLGAWGQRIGRPRAILMVSAHWLTPGVTAVSIVEPPRTIHDFEGFPQALYDVRYAAPGAPALAREVAFQLRGRRARTSSEWGLDHGAWSVLRHLYPAADVPVFQLSIDYAQPGAQHVAIGRDLAAFRDLGVLVIGSGNLVHNLAATEPGVADAPRASTAWAQAYDDAVDKAMAARDVRALGAWRALDASVATAVPTPDHYFPMLYVLGASRNDEAVQVVHSGFQSGTVSMRSVQFG
jgi:4,5-DOPA dioxygenase extradiol